MAALPAHQTLHAPGVTPARWMLFLHGILGRGANWRGFARRWLKGGADARSILAVMTLGAEQGAEVEVHASGPQAEAAAERMVELLSAEDPA